jgi:hypothetical protein
VRDYHRAVVAFGVEDLARTALVRILPRSRYRIAAQSDSRFASFAANTARITYRQQGATPALLLFSGPGQDPRAAAAAAAEWARANWRPNAVQRKVRPGVVVVQVAPRVELTTAGLVPGTAVPAAVWTVDSDTGRVEVAGSPPGSPSGGEVKRAAGALARGMPAPALGELDIAERAVMQVRTVAMPQVLGGVLSICLLIVIARFGFGAVTSLFALSSGLGATNQLSSTGRLLIYGELAANFLIVVGILVGLGVYFNVANLAYRVPGVSSPVPQTRRLTWIGYAAVMVVLVGLVDVALPAAGDSTVQGDGPEQFAHVTVTAGDDGTETLVSVGGDLTVDLSSWPSSEWAGVQFKTSNPSVLTLDSQPSAGAPPIARFSAHEAGASRVDAASSDGRYTYQVRVSVIT